MHVHIAVRGWLKRLRWMKMAFLKQQKLQAADLTAVRLTVKECILHI